MFRILFVEPRIAPNTGNAIRLAAVTGAQLHLVEPMGFNLSAPQVRRAGLDYHDMANVQVHSSLDAAWESLRPRRVYAFTAHAQRFYHQASYQPDDVLMFGPEPTGLSANVLADRHVTEVLRIPMLAARRSLNLSNAAAIVTYEAWRQNGFDGAV